MASSMIDIDALYKLAVDMKDDQSQLVSIVYLILDHLAEHQMSYVAHVPSPNMGIHPDNRAGKKMLGADVSTKGAKIVNVGFTFKFAEKTGRSHLRIRQTPTTANRTPLRRRAATRCFINTHPIPCARARWVVGT